MQPDAAQRMKNEQMTKSDWEQFMSYVDQISSDEQKLKSRLSEYSNFKDLKSGYDEAAKNSGIYYGNELLENQNAYRQATIDDLNGVMKTGAVLPEKIMLYLVHANNIDLAVELSNAGYSFNTTYTDDFRSMNALETYAESIAINPYESSAEEQVDSINKLIQLGVPVKVNDGTRDALDILLNGALTAEDEQSQKLLMAAQKINSQGVVLEESHRELLDKLRLKIPYLYDKFSVNFK